MLFPVISVPCDLGYNHVNKALYVMITTTVHIKGILWKKCYNFNMYRHYFQSQQSEKASQIAKTMESTTITHRSDTLLSNRCLIDADPRVFTLCDGIVFTNLKRYNWEIIIPPAFFEPPLLHEYFSVVWQMVWEANCLLTYKTCRDRFISHMKSNRAIPRGRGGAILMFNVFQSLWNLTGLSTF